MNTADLRRRIDRLKRDRAASRVGDRAVYDWYGGPCPCGLPPGECTEHPRARPAQRPPESDWRTWLVLAGRGFGKTRTATEWVRSKVSSGKARRVALVAPTAADVRDVLIEGPSGLLAVCPPWNRPKYEPSKRKLSWPGGAVAHAYSAEEPERLRGPQHDLALCDELGAWSRPQTFDMLMFGLRLGTAPQVCVATTPRPTALLKKIIGAKTTATTGGSTYDNRPHLAPEFLAEIAAAYEGTRLGRQELHAEMLDVLEGAWFPSFDPARHVTAEAEYQPGLPVRLAVDCGVSRHTGAVFYQVRELDAYRHRVTVFADFYAADRFSEANALAIRARGEELCGGRLDRVRLDPASTARTGVGTAAYGEYERVFGSRSLAFWPQHLVADGLDTVELLLDKQDLVIHPRCTHLIAAFNGYTRAQRGGEWMSWPADPNHPSEDLMDALRGGIRDALPEGRKPQPLLRRVPARAVW